MSKILMCQAYADKVEPDHNRVLVKVNSNGKGQPLWFLDLIVDGQQVAHNHERIKRSYSSANDALVSARHLLNEIQKGGGK